MLQDLFDAIRNSGQPLLNGFSSSEDVFSEFDLSSDESKSIDIIIANYECEYYDGSATVFYYRRDTEKYYETYGSHCSCYGLEGQWDGKEIVFKELENRLKINNFFGMRELIARFTEF